MNGVFGSFAGRRVFVTGHTGFKGSWLTLLLHAAGAEITGYALEAEETSMYRALALDELCHSVIDDVRDFDRLRHALEASRPDYVFHLAAQPVVLLSYEQPLSTLSTNIMGTAHVLEALRRLERSCAAVIVTSDKCYENVDRQEGYGEDDRLGGHDIYSVSKAAAELVVSGYRRSFFGEGETIRVATARAGNVIGGGDSARYRIVPDCIRALQNHEPVKVRNPHSVRPWQHVLDPIGGYLQLALRLAGDGGPSFCEAWNFGPADEARTVEDLVRAIAAEWGSGTWMTDRQDQPHEARLLRLRIEKAQARLDWHPRWPFRTAVSRTVEWYKAAARGAGPQALRELTLEQIRVHAEDGRVAQ